MAHYMLFFTVIVFVTLSELFTSTALHWFYALQCIYHSLTFQKIYLCLQQTNIKISEVQKITTNAFRKSKYVFSKLRNVIQVVLKNVYPVQSKEEPIIQAHKFI
jgi:hypothetical protein